MEITTALHAPAWIAAIAWCYLLSNSARLFTYLPQIAAVWRSRDGASAISLLTWSSWVLSHMAAVLYGLWVVADTFFVTVSTINLVGCSAVTVLAALRRREHARASAQRRPRMPLARATGME